MNIQRFSTEDKESLRTEVSFILERKDFFEVSDKAQELKEGIREMRFHPTEVPFLHGLIERLETQVFRISYDFWRIA